MAEVSIVVPAFNEGKAVGPLVQRVQSAFADSGHVVEIIVVDDGSEDETEAVAAQAGAVVLRHPLNMGYGNSLLTGIRHAKYPIIGITDADGTYPVHELPALVDELLERKLDMLVGSRRGRQYHGGFIKGTARLVFKFLAEFTCGREIPDVNSGLRVMRRDMVLQFADVLCGGFSFTTTLTMISFLTNRFVAFRSIDYHKRIGTSHVRHFRDTLRSLQILAMTILIFNPIKFYLLFAACLLAGGFLACFICLVLPGLTVPVLVASAFFLSACLLMGFGFLAEQRRASPDGVGPFLRAPCVSDPEERHRPAEDLCLVAVLDDQTDHIG